MAGSKPTGHTIGTAWFRVAPPTKTISHHPYGAAEAADTRPADRSTVSAPAAELRASAALPPIYI